MKMLKGGRCEIFSSVVDERVVGIVRSQTSDSVYVNHLGADARYGCSQEGESVCMGLQGSICKHLLTLVIGLVHGGLLPQADGLSWVKACAKKRPNGDEAVPVDTLIKFRAAAAGELDWRPLETTPEDFYAY